MRGRSVLKVVTIYIGMLLLNIFVTGFVGYSIFTAAFDTGLAYFCEVVSRTFIKTRALSIALTVAIFFTINIIARFLVLSNPSIIIKKNGKYIVKDGVPTYYGILDYLMQISQYLVFLSIIYVVFYFWMPDKKTETQSN